MKGSINMKLLQLVIKDFKMLFRYKNLIILSIVFPLLVLGILGFIFSDLMSFNKTVDKIDIGIVNKDSNKASNLLINDFRENKAFVNLFNIKEYDLNKALEEYEKGNLISIVEIPEGFSDSLMYFKNDTVNVTLNPIRPLESLIFKNIMSSYSKYVSTTDIAVYSLYEQIKNIGLEKSELNKINDAFSIEMIFTALGRDKFFLFEPITIIPSSTSIEYFVIAISVIFIMYIGLIGTNLIIYERNSMCLSRYRISSSSLLSFILSKIIVLFLYAIMQLVIFMGLISLFIDFDISLFQSLFFISISIIHILSISIFIGSYIKNEEIATLVGNIGIFVLALIGGSFIPLQLMPIEMQYLSQFTPNYWIIKGLLFIFKGFELRDISLNILVLITTSIILITLSAIKLRKSR